MRRREAEERRIQEEEERRLETLEELSFVVS
jgi:hypothetical protein